MHVSQVGDDHARQRSPYTSFTTSSEPLRTIKLARHYLPHWMFYPACAIAAFIVVCGVGAAIVKWKENRDSERAGKIA